MVLWFSSRVFWWYYAWAEEAAARYVLYDAPDEGYPESLRDFYNKNIDNQPALQNDMLLAVDALYKVAGTGGLVDYDE